jgi:hypothetical protein
MFKSFILWLHSCSTLPFKIGRLTNINMVWISNAYRGNMPKYVPCLIELYLCNEFQVFNLWAYIYECIMVRTFLLWSKLVTSFEFCVGWPSIAYW